MKKPLLPAIICGIFAMIAVALYLNSLEVTYKKGAQKVKVLVAKQYIDQGTMIDEAMLYQKDVPKDYLQPKAIQAVKELTSPEGKRLFMALTPIERGEQIVTTKLSQLGLDTGISSIIPNEKRAVTLLFDREMVSGIVKPGNRMDLIGVFEYEDRERRTAEGAFTVLQDALVLAVGKQVLGAAKSGSSGKEKEAVTFEDSKIPVSIAVTPQEAEAVVLSSERGIIRFSLRPTGDESILDIKGLKMQDIAKEVSSTVKSTVSPDTAEYSRDMKKRQREVMELLNKYQKQ